jgi:uncharacterized OB-fold protein
MSESTYPKPIPDLEDPDMGPFWQAARQQRLTAQRCTSCRTLRFPALPICDTCLELGFEWEDVSTDGTIWSYVVYHRAFHPGFADDLPYVVAIVENADGLRFVGNVVGPRENVEVGSKVKAVFDAVTPEFTMVKWALAE